MLENMRTVNEHILTNSLWQMLGHRPLAA